MKPRVAILRGEALNRFELQSYEPLVDAYDVLGVGEHHGLYCLDGLGLPVVRLRRVGRGSVARRLFGDRSERLLGLKRVLSQCAIVHSAETFLPISEQAVVACLPRGIPLVLTCWENIPFLHDDDGRLAERKFMVRDAAAMFLAVTDAAREALLLEGVPSERVIVQPMGVNRDVFRPSLRDETLGRQWSIPQGWRTVLYCGRLIREKGVLDLVRAVALLPMTILILVGSGPERRRLESAARALDISDRVRFVGGAAYDDMPRIYSMADVFCLPSVTTPYWQEQFGMVLVEAMACGVPVVTTASGSIPEVVGESGVVTAPYASTELADALRAVLDDHDLATKLSRAGQLRVQARFDATRVAAAIGDLYARLLRASRA